MNAIDQVPAFYLYGEPHRPVDVNFLHVESLDYRSRPANWTIRPHSHHELNHIIVISRGGGVMHTDGIPTSFKAPCLLLVPSRVVHGFQWLDDSSGAVITISNTYCEELVRRDPDLALLFAAPEAVPASKDVVRTIASKTNILMKELSWAAPGRQTAFDAAFGATAVLAIRALNRLSPDPDRGRGRHADLVARFREMVEQRFRLREPVTKYAELLGVSPTTLRVACTRISGKPPADILNVRTLLEAKRSLCYTNQSVAEIAYALGFADPAYFTRTFTKQAGSSPRKFRIDHATG